MKNLLHFVFLSLLVFMIAPAQAQDTSTPNIASEQTSINQENLDKFIKTLEDDASRGEFLKNLKTLSDIHKQEQENLKLDLGLNEISTGFVASYEKILDKIGVSSGLLGQLMLTFFAIIVWIIIVMIIANLSNRIKLRFDKIRKKFKLTHQRFRFYIRMLKYVGYVVTSTLAIYTLSFVWDLRDKYFILGEFIPIFLINLFNIVTIATIAVVIWEIINTSIERYLYSLDGSSAARMRTIIPIARNILFIVFTVLFSLVLLSELGIDIMPLLAGAGVLGIAIGFGAQTMVKDFLTGFTIILEDLIQVGDVARLSGHMGVVEKITMRKVQLRDADGIVSTIPFSEILIVENLTKDFSFYPLNVSVAYHEDTDNVINTLKSVDEDMRQDPEFKDIILAPIDIFGVDKFMDSAVTIKGRIKTLPGKQWFVGREFNRRMKYVFDKNGIEIPFPHQKIIFEKDAPAQAVNKYLQATDVENLP